MTGKPPPTITTACGTTRGYAARHRLGERPCRPCLDANRTYRSELQACRFTPPAQRTDPTDTGAGGKGYQRHHRAGEHACDARKAACTTNVSLAARVGRGSKYPSEASTPPHRSGTENTSINSGGWLCRRF